MEQIGKLHPKNFKELPNISIRPSEIKKTETGYEISVYNDKLTKEFAAKMTEKIAMAYPKLQDSFFPVFYDRIKENGFTNERLRDAVNYVIDNCQYPEPSIAQFVSFDKTVKLKTYHEICSMCDENTDAFKYYQAVNVGIDRAMFALKTDVEKYHLKKWKDTDIL